MDFTSGLEYYSDDEHACFITDGVMHTLAELRQSYEEVGPSVERLHNTIQDWQVQILSPDVVVFILPVQLTIKLTNVPEYTGQLIWTATLQKQNDQWKIVQSHESWLNCAEVTAALSNEE